MASDNGQPRSHGGEDGLRDRQSHPPPADGRGPGERGACDRIRPPRSGPADGEERCRESGLPGRIQRRRTAVQNATGYRRNQSFTVELELAARVEGTPARNTVFSVSWGESEADYGFVRSLPQTFQTEVNSVRLSYTGTGVSFYLNTGGRLWQRIEPGEETLLDQPGGTLTIRVVLMLDEGTNLQDYKLEINPYHDMSFTGKFLEPEIGLIYFGGRWYEPGIGRWVTVDPAEDGGNWYEYCSSDPICNFDPDGMISWKNLWTLCKGVGAGFKIYAPQKTLEIGIALVVGSAMTVSMSVLMPVFPVAIPVIAAVMPYISTAMMVPFALDLVGDIQYLIKQFSPVFLSKNPSNTKLRAYGIRISKVSINIIAMTATSKGMQVIMKTGILQKLGGNIANKIFGKKITIIGRDMPNRVKPTAKNLGGEVYNPGPDEGWAKNLGANRKWINKIMDQERIIVDVGQPEGYSPSDYYNLELREIAKRNYRTIKLDIESPWYKWLKIW